MLAKFYSDKLNAGCGTRTVKLIHMRLKQALKRAVEHDLVARNVADAVKAPRDHAKEMTCWTAAEVKRFLDAAKDCHYGPVWELSLATGMRKGEFMGLAWQDVDFGHNTVTVRQTVGVHRNGSPYMNKPKTKNSRRTIDVPPSVMAMLREHKTRQLEKKLALGPAWRNAHDLVFTAEMGTIIGPRNIARNCERLIAKAGVPKISVHSQRHTHVTLLLLNGDNVKAVSERVGHASIGITLETYGHIVKEQRREVANSVEKLLFAASGG
jgi:integrase